MRGQISAEFLIVMVLVMMLFGFALFVYSVKNEELIFFKERYEAKHLSSKIGDFLNNVYVNNVSADLFLENKFNFDYNAYVLGNSVYLEQGDEYVDYPLVFSADYFEISLNNWLRAEKVNGKVVLENYE